ncbi:GIY-YIG nuclease family protein [Mucilaginibacter dorajii]|uniref:GIY-YIG nuclease family protein n=1 Tax=Mucilaginibacter dorajii TaxID=692994 RepID=A0ABP7R6G6_9SPHI|nr:GIY-YIG nuclease family protein [Mucilaginibacter dorajii]MCS3737694.1 hypothetical protein [Mucilaginibacter dorajii]
MANTLDDIFDDDEFGLLNPNVRQAGAKTDEDRLISAFEEINTFIDTNGREPATGSMSEYTLLGKLNAFRGDEAKKRILKPYDRHQLLGQLAAEARNFDDVVADDDLGLLEYNGDTSIFEFNYTPKPSERAASDFVAQRKPLSEKEFAGYETMFQQVHRDLKAGKRKLLPFDRLENNLQQGNFYLLDGLLLYLETADIEPELRGVNTGGRVQLDGRTLTIFENGTKSNMLFRSLGKSLQKNGKLVTQTASAAEAALQANASVISGEDLESGWIYVLRSKSADAQISNIENLFKIGFSSQEVSVRIRNAEREATYLMAGVEVIATYRCFNINPRQLENLLHRFFGDCCLQIDLHDTSGMRITPREWFVVPLSVIDETIHLILNGNIVNYRYDAKSKVLRLI